MMVILLITSWGNCVVSGPIVHPHHELFSSTLHMNLHLRVACGKLPYFTHLSFKFPKGKLATRDIIEVLMSATQSVRKCYNVPLANLQSY